MQTFRLVAYSESTADVRACMPQAVCAGTGVPSCVCVMSHASCTLLQFYNDQNVTKINASRFEREGCSESCYQNYALTGIDLAHTRAHARTHVPMHLSCSLSFLLHLTRTKEGESVCTYITSSTSVDR